MINRFDAARLQPVLLGVALAAAVLAALALLLSGRAMQQQTQLREHVADADVARAEHPAAGGRRGSWLGAGVRRAGGVRGQRLERVLDEIDAGKSTLGLFATPERARARRRT